MKFTELFPSFVCVCTALPMDSRGGRNIPIIKVAESLKYTLPKTNIFAPTNGWLEYYFPIGEAYFQGLC